MYYNSSMNIDTQKLIHKTLNQIVIDCQSISWHVKKHSSNDIKFVKHKTEAIERITKDILHRIK